MKKNAILLAGSIIVFSCNQVNKEIPKNADMLADNLKGHVEQTIDSTFKTDSTGKIGEQDSCCVIIQKYDELGYATQNNSNYRDGTENYKTVFTHDDKGNVKSVRNTKNGKLISSISVYVGNNGNYSGARSFDSTGKMDSYYTNLTSNDYGQLTSFRQFKPDSTLKMSVTSTYAKQLFTGNRVKDSSGKETYSSKITLDDKNNVIENITTEVTKDSTINKTIKYRYNSFDDKSNWTQRTQMDENVKPVQIDKRTITYYKN
jgi:hypothetical protein